MGAVDVTGGCRSEVVYVNDLPFADFVVGAAAPRSGPHAAELVASGAPWVNKTAKRLCNRVPEPQKTQELWGRVAHQRHCAGLQLLLELNATALFIVRVL